METNDLNEEFYSTQTPTHNSLITTPDTTYTPHRLTSNAITIEEAAEELFGRLLESSRPTCRQTSRMDRLQKDEEKKKKEEKIEKKRIREVKKKDKQSKIIAGGTVSL